ncbi:MAG: tetratricopeptide repeat protein, partial [Candidatus Brocadiia bacterium]
MLAKVQRIAFLLVCAALLLGLAASGSSAEETAISKGPFPYTSIRLLELQYGPKKYVNKYVTFECKFSRTGELYKPVQTGLLPELHQNFYAWDSLLPLWIPDKRAKLACLTLYMLKTSVSYNDFMKLKPYQRVVVWGSVRSDLSGQPWIEVRQLDTVSGPSLDEDFYTAMYQGYMQLMAENYTKALGFLSRIAKRSLPPFEEGALCGMLGECYFFLGNYKMATRYFDRACDLNPGDKKLAAFLVKALYFARNYPRSKDVAEKLLTVDPSLAEIRCYLALSKGRTGMVEEGLADVKAALNADPMLTFAYEVQSDLFAMKNDLTSAIAAIEKAVSLEPTNVRYQYRRAELYEESGDIAKAKEGYGYALSIKKDYAPASLALARLAMKEGDKEAAMKLVESAAKADASAETLFATGRLYYSFGDKDKALEYFQMTLDADPTFVDALDYAGMVSLSAGRLEAAREYFTRSLEALPDGKDARMGFCRALLWQEKDTRKALDIARALATDYSSDPAANAILGYALTLEGSLEEGAKLIASSIQAQPAEAEFQFYMGVNLFKQKKYSEAIPYLNTACKYEPFNVIGVKYLDAATSEAGKANARLEKDERSRQEQLKREQDKKAAAQERAKRDEDRRKAAIARAEARRAQAAAAKPGERPTTGVRKAAQPAATTRVEKPAQPAGTPPGAKRISREEAETTKDRPLILVREPRKPEPVAKAAPFEILLDRTPAAPKEWYKKYGHKPAPTEHPSIEVAPPKM